MTTLLHRFEQTVSAKRSNIFACWYNGDGAKTEERSFGEVWDEAGMVAYYLRQVWNLERGDRVILCYDFGLHFFSVFLGCLRAGVTAVLVYPPSPPLANSLPVLTKIIEDCSPRLILTCRSIQRYHSFDTKNPLSKSRSLWPKEIEFKATDILRAQHVLEEASRWLEQTGDFHNAMPVPPFLQYTSGSTADPKGVRVTHTALEANLEILRTGFIGSFGSDGGVVPADMTGCMWLPQYHDMGLMLTIYPFIAGWKLHLMSPVTFIKNPPLWMDLLSQTRSHWTCAPTFAIRLTARKFSERERKEGPQNLDLSCLRKIQVCAEPIQPDTKQVFDKVFSKYGLRDDWFKVAYGLAEYVVGVTWVVGSHTSVVDGKPVSSKMVASGSRHTLHPSVAMKVVEPETYQELPDGQIGEIWLSGRSVTGGYQNNPQLSNETFCARIEGDTETTNYLRTGDLGFFDDNGHLFISGRIKDLIIVNGVNYYPQDIETVAQEASDAIRPGCVAAFSTDDTTDDLVIVFEVRNSSRNQATELAQVVHQAVASNIGLVPSRMIAIAERTIPKTTSGKIRRRQTRMALRKGKLVAVGEIRDHSHQFANLSYVVPENVPSDVIPSSIHEVVSSIAINEQLLEEKFEQLQLKSLPGVAAAWSAADKSQAALQQICKKSLMALQANFPTLVQFLHLLELKHDEWILEGDKNRLSSLLHCVFVLHWATEQLVPKGASDASLLGEKIREDDKAEEQLLSELGLDGEQLPEMYTFLADGRSTDASYGVVSPFLWLKQRSVRYYGNFLAHRSGNHNYYTAVGDTLRSEDGGFNLGVLNILEAMWLDQHRGFADNAFVGHWLASRAGHTVKPDNSIPFDCKNWTYMYGCWNMAVVVSAYDCTPGHQEWLLAKHLIPCLASASPENFLKYRFTSLYLAVQVGFMDQIRGASRSPGWFSRSAANAFGVLNRRHISALNDNDKPNWEDPILEENPNKLFASWLHAFDASSGRAYETSIAESLPEADKFDSILQGVLGQTIDFEATWEEIGLSSMAAVQLRDKINEAFSATLPSDCFEKYATPSQLKQYVLSHDGLPIPTKLSEKQEEGLKVLHVSLLVLGAIQTVGVLALLLLFVFTLIPPFLVQAYVSKSVLMGSGMNWLPVFIPVWIASFSLLLILLKWMVIGKYREGQASTPSLWYFRWWIVDRFLHLYEVTVGQFILDTPLIWVVYSLLGAKIHPSAKIQSFVREHDLVEVGEHSKVTTPLRCRSFLPWHEEEEGPVLSFRPISIGKQCTGGGFIAPGSDIGDFAVIEKLSVLQEGSQVQSGVRAEGNPALIIGPSISATRNDQWLQFGTMKMLWLVAELYIFAGLSAIAQALLAMNHHSWRYRELLSVFLVVLMIGFLSLLVSILLKWALIGRQSPGEKSKGLRHEISKWACDYHYKVTAAILSIFSNSKFLWNLALKAHGMDTDLQSIVDYTCVYPSNVDLITMKSSMISQTTLETEKDGHLHRVELRDGSTGGYLSRIEPGVNLSGITVPPFNNVTSSSDASQDNTQCPRNSLSSFQLLSYEVQTTLLYVVYTAAIFATIIPSYEIAKVAIETSPLLSVPALAAALFLHFLVSFGLLHVMNLIADGHKSRTETIPTPLYRLYHSANYFTQEWTIQSLFWGTPFFPMILKALGSHVEGRLLYFGFRFYEPTMLRFKDRTIVDECNLSGHNITFQKATYGKVIVSGLVQRVFALADSRATQEKSGPYHTLSPLNEKADLDIEMGLSGMDSSATTTDLLQTHDV